MSNSNQDTVPKTFDAPCSLDNRGTAVPSDETSVGSVALIAPNVSQGLTRDSLESTLGHSDLRASVVLDVVAQTHHDIYNSAGCALPPSLLAEQIAYNFPASRPMATSSPATSPSAITDTEATPAPRKPYRKIPLSELSAQEKETRQRLLASCNQDRDVFLNFLKEPNHGGLAPERVAVLQRVFRHYTMSSFPASNHGIEANKKARRDGLAEIAHLKAQKESGRQEGIDDLSGVHGRESTGASAPENTQQDEPKNSAESSAEGGSKAESEDTGPETEGQDHISDGVTLSYSLNGKECTKEELDDGTSRYPRNALPEEPQMAAQIPIAEYLQDHQSPVPQQYAQQIPSQQMHSQQMHSKQIHGQQMHSQQMHGQFQWAPPYQGQYYQGYPPWF